MVDSPQSSPSMEGFGSSDMTTPFHYGSVHDSQLRSDSLEQKLRKQYWKTKQTVLQKLGKGQDEFIVAGDMEIDTKLEKAYHLQSSCTALLQAVDKYMSRLRTVSVQESVMSEHLRTWSETEYTNAGEVMQNVGKLQDKDSKSRYQVIPPLLRLHKEFLVFRGSAIRDLNESIQLLEKARTEYRAALLWMKDVSEKLHNPDYKDQLIRFREAQGAVKETKRRFEKLKVDLGEKIDMVSASRCNLLSRSLPNYQKEVLDYTDTVASEFHSLLVDLRTHHHHQYKVRRVLEEIRDLEAEEMPFNDQPGMDDSDQFSALHLPEDSNRRPLFDDGDDPLLDLGAGNKNDAKEGEEAGKGGGDGANGGSKNPKEGDAHRRVGDPFSLEEVAEQAKVKDLVLGGIEAELKALQNEVITPRDPTQGSTSPAPPPAGESPKASGSDQVKSQAEKEIDDLLKLDSDLPDDLSLLSEREKQEQQGGEGSASQDTLSSEWNNFSAFMPATREDGGAKSPLAGWERELMGSPTNLPDPISPSELGVAESRTPAASVPSKPPPKAEDTPVSNSAPSTSSAATSASSTKPATSPPHPQLGTDSIDHAPKDTPSGGTDSDTSIDKLLGLSTGANSAVGGSGGGGVADELLSEELNSLGISTVQNKAERPNLTAPSSSSASDISSIDSSLFGLHSSQPSLPQSGGSVLLPQQPQQVSPFRSPLGTTQGPPLFPTQGTMGMVMAPPRFGLVGPGAMATAGPAGTQQVGGPAAPPPTAAVGGASSQKGGAKEEEKGKTWMNFFAHLDPLVNEKA